MIVGLILSIVIPFIIGYGLISVIASGRIRLTMGERIAFSYPLGAAAITLEMALWPLLKIPYSFVGLVLPWIILGGIMITLPAGRAMLSASFVRPRWDVLSAMIAVWVVLKTIWLLAEIALRPVNAWDAVAYWSLMGKIFFYERTWSPALAALTRGASQPLFNPLIQTWTALSLGGWNENWVQLPFAILFISLVAAIGVTIARLGSIKSGWIAAGLMMGLPFAAMHAIVAYSDLPLAVFHGMAYLLLLIYANQQDKRVLILSAIFMLLTIWAKRHGIIYTGVWGVCVLLLELRGRTIRSIPVRLWTMAVAGALLLAGLFWTRIGVIADWGWHADRLGEILSILTARLFTYGHWNILWAMALWALIAAWMDGARKERRLFATIPWVLLIGLGLFYTVCGDELYRWFLDGTVINRYVLHIVPLAVISVSLLVVDTLNGRKL